MRHWFDDDDIFSWLLLLDGVRRGWVLGILLVVIAVVSYFAWSDSGECARLECPSGQHPIVASGECVCVTGAR